MLYICIWQLVNAQVASVFGPGNGAKIDEEDALPAEKAAVLTMEPVCIYIDRVNPI